MTLLTDSRDDEPIVLEGEADQAPGKEAGDIVFVIKQKPHDVFERRGNDLVAHISISLAEALCGFSRVVIESLDGRGLHVEHKNIDPLR